MALGKSFSRCEGVSRNFFFLWAKGSGSIFQDVFHSKVPILAITLLKVWINQRVSKLRPNQNPLSIQRGMSYTCIKAMDVHVNPYPAVPSGG